MHELSENLRLLRTLLLAAAPALYLLAACTTNRQPSLAARAWRRARYLGAVAIGVACASLAVEVIDGPIVISGPVLVALGAELSLRLSLRSDAVGALVQLLVSFIGWVILGYSQTCLMGEQNQPRYLRALLLTLAAVSLVLISDNLVVLALAWLGTSLALHRLLTFYRNRRPAVIAAHKKFIASRLGDVCLGVAILLIAAALNTFEISTVTQRVQGLSALSPGLQFAAVLLVCTALLKCAQLPTHGWLIQVMEAPTPVSALLHAGVVNLGGFLMFRLAGLVAHVPAAQTLLVIAGSATAVIAGLVMMTRISIKVMLAWSTCAQMGFMLMECGLGLYDMALLHLIAHSLYKAHAFLSAGGAVEQARLAQLTPVRARVAFGDSAMAAMAGIALFGIIALMLHSDFDHSRALWVTAATVGLALPSLFLSPALTITYRWRIAAVLAAFGTVVVFFGLHALFGVWIQAPTFGAEVTPFRILWIQASFVLLFLLQSAIRANPDGGIGQRLYPWFYAGLYLDEVFTRITFRVWPVRPLDASRDAPIARMGDSMRRP